VAIRSIASLSISFGLVSIPVKVYAATESSAALRFKLLSRGGARVRRQYVADPSESPLVLEDIDEEAPAARGEERTTTEQGGRDERRPAVSLAPSASTSASEEPLGRAASVASRARREDAPSPPPRSAAIDAAEPDGDGSGDDERGALRPGQIVKGYEFAKGRFVTFTEAELKELAQASRQTIDIVSFIPENAVDPIHYDKAYFLAPDRLGAKPYSLLREAMARSGRTALARWAWRAKEYVAQIRPVAGGLVLQQLLYADEVRSIDALGIELVDVGDAELQLALRLIEQTSEDTYRAERFVDEEKARILAAVERKIAGRSVVAQPARALPSAQVIDLVAALRASLDALAPPAGNRRSARADANDAPTRKPARRAARSGASGTTPQRAAKNAGSATTAAPRARGRQSAR
jgi:DNA end-binding protein Ku